MTIDEAIEIITSIDKAYRAFSKEEYKALEMAIKALKQEPILDKILDKAKSEIRYGENKAYNADFTMGCEYAISVIERIFEGG